MLPYVFPGSFQVLLDGFVYSLDLSVTLGMPGRREHFLDPELLTKHNELRVIELSSVVCDQRVREPESAYDVLPQKICTFGFSSLSQGLDLDPLRKIIYSY